ncbi:hypothetical protein [Chryseobacterium oncorhynchi]|uniref:Uncharacterized protein n=1 Tax=Chryseobacterium oncorhynchi TaxID=741074 RepID=A0A316X2A5_9FLAO|nr:hypothetical protein [Chryseobacterium oncorhynchi]PWN67664.1 hypothetical protein C1638_003475 [Chryseobacterium oncorhynchi]
MKNTFIISALCSLASYASGQVAINKENITGTSTVLDFNNTTGNSKGIILSSVDSAPVLTANNNGTFLFDKTDKKIKMYENNTWTALSNIGDSSQIIPNPSTESGSNQGVIIGKNTSSAIGVLVLESQDKAVLLPQINTPHTTVKSPYPGMMCYDTASKSLAVFDGSSWNYWK